MKMGVFANSRFTAILAWIIAAAILGFNFELLYLTLRPA
jgi:Mn2+/Fe2+ NRAMP family transporter